MLWGKLVLIIPWWKRTFAATILCARLGCRYTRLQLGISSHNTYGTPREEQLIKGCLCSRKHHVAWCAHKDPTFSTWVHSQVNHHLGSWCHLVFSYFLWDKDVCSTSKNPDVVNRRFLTIHPLIGVCQFRHRIGVLLYM